MGLKVKKEKKKNLAHHGIIKLIVSDALRSLKHAILWVYFLNMDLQSFEDSQEEIREEDKKKGKNLKQ
jgi:hypothetical protein